MKRPNDAINYLIDMSRDYGTSNRNYYSVNAVVEYISYLEKCFELCYQIVVNNEEKYKIIKKLIMKSEEE